MRARLIFVLGVCVACGASLPLVGSDGGADAGQDVVVDDVVDTTVDAADAGPDGCSPNQTTCGGACVSLGTDSKNCGRCGHDCLGGACTAGACAPVKIGPANNGWGALAEDLTNLYWIGGDTIYRMSKDGGAVQPLVSFVSGMTSLAVDGQRVYFNVEGIGANNGAIMTLPVDSDGGVAPTTLYGSQDQPSAIAIDSTTIYWTNRGLTTPGTGTVMQAPLTPGTITPLATGLTDPDTVAVDGTYVYWAESGSKAGQVSKTPIGGGAITPLAIGTYPGYLEVTPEAIFFASSGNGGVEIEAIANDGGVSQAALLPQSPGGMTVDTQYLYYTTGNYPGTVGAIALDGGGTTVVWGPQGMPYGIAVDDVAIYWLDPSIDNAFWKLAK